MTNHRTGARGVAGIAAITAGLVAGAAPRAALAAVDAGTAPSQQPAEGFDRGRIQFAPGTSSGSVNGAVARGNWDHWAARALGGQTIEVTITAHQSNATFELYTPAGSQMANDVTSFSGTLPADGDYAIDVGSAGGIANYTLNVTITGEPARPAAQRIAFAPGTDNATVQGSLAPGTTTSYMLRAAAGQTMHVSLGPDEFAALTTIFGPDGDVVGAGHTSASASLPVTGDYVVEIGNTGSTTAYTMTVRIPAVTPPPADGHFRGRIQFPAGTDSASVSGVVPRGDWDEWSFRAGAGQTVNLSVAAAASNSTFSLYAPNGSPLAAHTTSFTGTLPASGLYMIEVGSTGGTANYTLNLQITGQPALPRDGHFRGQIQFAPGTDSGSVSGVVPSGDWDEWSFRAAGGQTANLSVAGNSTFSIYAPDGRPLAAHTTSFSGTLPASGLYMIEVGSTGGTANYTLNLQIT